MGYGFSWILKQVQNDMSTGGKRLWVPDAERIVRYETETNGRLIRRSVPQMPGGFTRAPAGASPRDGGRERSLRRARADPALRGHTRGGP